MARKPNHNRQFELNAPGNYQGPSVAMETLPITADGQLVEIHEAHALPTEIHVAAGTELEPNVTALPAETSHLGHYLAIPLPEAGPVDNGYCARHMHLELTFQQAQAARSLFQALDGRQDRLANGRVVASSADAIRWLLEQIAVGNEGTIPTAG